MSGKNIKFLFVGILFILSIGMSAMLYPDLPARYPVHFGLSGAPDRWADKSLVSWFLVPGVGGFILASLYGATVFTRKKPELINIINKEKFLRMSDAEREPVFNAMDNLFVTIGTSEQLLFGFIQYELYTAAVYPPGNIGTLLLPVIMGFSVVTLLIVCWFLVKISSAMKA